MKTIKKINSITGGGLRILNRLMLGLFAVIALSWACTGFAGATLAITSGYSGTIYEYDNSTWTTSGAVSAVTIDLGGQASVDTGVLVNELSGTYQAIPDTDFDYYCDQPIIELEAGFGVTIPAGERYATIYFLAIDGSNPEEDIGLQISLSLGTYTGCNYTPVNPSSATVTIYDGD